MKKLTPPIPIATATSETSHHTHGGTAAIRATTNELRPPALAKPRLFNNLISIHNLARTYGPVIFTNTSAIATDTRRPKPRVIAFAPRQTKSQAYVFQQQVRRKAHTRLHRTSHPPNVNGKREQPPTLQTRCLTSPITSKRCCTPNSQHPHTTPNPQPANQTSHSICHHDLKTPHPHRMPSPTPPHT